ncbi:MAG: helix-turn-helix transcriptional regulator [Anaerolineaceae bacterium]|nr:helix-turn-helix transcriptional regulator [Anaerolineaceae bacterium]
MPYGVGRGPGRGRGRKRNRRIINFLRPCILLLLSREKAHGYNLISGLNEFGFEAEKFDPSLIYRSLREMEEMELVTSEWHEESLGPQRRIYEITTQGKEHLGEWIKDLRRVHSEISVFLKAYEAIQE